MGGEIPSTELPIRRFRRLRIAVSAFFAILTVALIVMWVRSYYRSDILFHLAKNNHVVGIGSEKCMVYLWPGHSVPPVPSTSGLQRWVLTSDKIGNRPSIFQRGHFQWTDSAGITRITVPYWFISSVVAAAAYLPWIKHFSLRTLLIAMTLVAVALGLGVWLTR